jgi:hypothetical protein
MITRRTLSTRPLTLTAALTLGLLAAAAPARAQDPVAPAPPPPSEAAPPPAMEAAAPPVVEVPPPAVAPAPVAAPVVIDVAAPAAAPVSPATKRRELTDRTGTAGFPRFARARLMWAGFGVRMGSTSYRVTSGFLRAQARKVDATVDGFAKTGAQAVGLPAPTVSTDLSRVRDFSSSMTTLVPSLHLGGDGYFFKMDGVIGLGSGVKTFGLGIYPINYGYLIRPVGLLPYLSLGFAAHYLSGKTTEMTSEGGLGQLRAAMGLKWCALDWVTFSAELGLSAAAAGIKDTRTAPGQQNGLAGVGGFGKSLDFSFGVELL